MPTFSSLVLLILGLIGLGCAAVWLIRRAVRWIKLEKLPGLLHDLFAPPPEVLPLLTLSEALKFFVTECPADERVTRGAMLREPHEQGWLVTQVFLDARNDLVLRSDGSPHGRKVIVRQMDDRLGTLFAGGRVVVVPGVSRLLDRDTSRTLLTRADALAYFARHRPADPRVVRGALLVRRGLTGYLCQQVFLDEQDQLVCAAGGKPYGRQFRVADIDDELRDTLNGHDLLVVNLREAISSAATTAAEAGQPVAKPADLPAAAPPAPTTAPERQPVGVPAKQPAAQPDVLTYAAAMRYFVEQRPRDPRVRKGAIHRRRNRRELVIEQVFLDARGRPVTDPRGRPYGRTLVVAGLDAELDSAFGKHDLILVD
jgi:hypothetical protein